ncbi:MAG: hypothetical protein KAS32_01600, partial [Candidatus Peribacteraceae bacterium]|nr:hypothetical protein [Candidatus Peribacteraceae bacterium]
CTEDENGIKISVHDNGCGIPKHEQFQVFRKFFRAENATIHHPDGAGLNLYFAYALAELLGGKMSFTSTEGLGSKFVVNFSKKDKKA